MSDPSPPQRSFAPQAVNAARTATMVNLAMSQMADQKASILMGATFVVITLVIGQASQGQAPLALLVLGGFAFLSACFAVAVVMPATQRKYVASEHNNLMFFGVIGQTDEAAYVEQMLDNLADDETMFRMMLHDVWQNAQVLLHKKYRLLGYAYRTFLAGLVITLVVFVGEMLNLLP